MFVQFNFENGSNPYIAKTNAEIFRMIKKYYINDFLTLRNIKTGSKAIYLSVRKNKISEREKAKCALRELAFLWKEFINGYNDYMYYEFSFWANFFKEYGKKYGLLTEFQASGIIKK